MPEGCTDSEGAESSTPGVTVRSLLPMVSPLPWIHTLGPCWLLWTYNKNLCVVSHRWLERNKLADLALSPGSILQLGNAGVQGMILNLVL